MTHPSDLLTDYVLGDLPAAEAAELERHLAGCASCRAELRELRAALVGLVESAAPTAGPGDAWEGVAARLERERAGLEPHPPLPPPPSSPPWAGAGRALPWTVAVVFLLLAGAGIWWGAERGDAYRQAALERRRVAGWLTRSDVRWLTLRSDAERPPGSVLLADDASALVVLRDPAPRGRVYAAWGYEGDQVALLWSGRNPVFEVELEGFDELYLSLEPRGEVDAPSEAFAEFDYQRVRPAAP